MISACLEHIDSSANANANVVSDSKRYWNVIATHCSYDGLSVIKVIICVAIKILSSIPLISSSFVVPYCVKPLLEKISSPVNITISSMSGDSFGPTQFTTNTTILDVKRAYASENEEPVSAFHFFINGNEEEISNKIKIKDLLSQAASSTSISPASLSLFVVAGESDAAVLRGFAQRSVDAMAQPIVAGRWSLQEWLNAPDVKDWRGVEIDEDGYITGLNLFDLDCDWGLMNLDFLKDLHFLTNLNLRSLLLQEIPDSISEIENLEVLNLSFNRIEGAIPDSLGRLTRLKKLDLSWNMLGGAVPESFRNLTNLDVLSVDGNSHLHTPRMVVGLIKLENRIKSVYFRIFSSQFFRFLWPTRWVGLFFRSLFVLLGCLFCFGSKILINGTRAYFEHYNILVRYRIGLYDFLCAFSSEVWNSVIKDINLMFSFNLYVPL